MKALITGITGFVGRHLAEHLLARGDTVLGTTRGDATDQSSLLGGIALLSWDVAQEAGGSVLDSVAQFAPDCIYHLAAISVPSDCGPWAPSDQAWAANVRGTIHVLRLAAAQKHRPRVLFASSCQVYAPVHERNWLVGEDGLAQPHRAYGITKLAAEQEIQRLAPQLGIEAVIARAFNHSGPGQLPRFMLPEWAKQIASNDNTPIKVQNRDAFLDLSDVRDVVAAYRLLAERGQPGAIVNVGSGLRRKSGDILVELLRIAGVERPIEERSPGSKQGPIADITRLVSQTGWQPRIPLAQTLADTLADWRSRASDLVPTLRVGTQAPDAPRPRNPREP